MYSIMACRAASPAVRTAARSALGAPVVGNGARRTVAAYGATSITKAVGASPRALLNRPPQRVSLVGTREMSSSTWGAGVLHMQVCTDRGYLVLSPCGGSRGLSSQEGRGETGEGTKEAEEDESKEETEKGSAEDDWEVVALKKDLAKSEEQLMDARGEVLYLAAEMENVRSIAKRDAEKARLYAVQKFAKQLLDVADNLERAVVSAQEGGERGDSPQDVLLQGVKMTSDELQKIFRSQGLEQYGEGGDTFDPHLHDAIFAYPDPTQEPGTVGQVLKCGYKLHGRVIRAAQVGTVKNA